MAAVDFFLKLDGIDGESTDEAHIKWIPVESFSWGVSNPVTVGGATGGAGAGKAVPSDFSLVIPVSSASPTIFLKLVTGQHINTATLSARKAGGRGSNEFLKYDLDTVFVSSLTTEGGGDVPMEQVSLRFIKIEVAYTPQRPDGSAGVPLTAGWDFVRNVSV
jgi:type VI secretion system secreted protein Hcp